MDNIVIIGSGVILVLMIIGAFIVLRDQTAPIGAPPSAKKGPGKISSSGQTAAPGSGPSIATQLHGPDGNLVNLEDVKAHLRNNRKIEAIKEIRELTGLGLTEAKDVAERLEQELRELRG